MIRFEISTFGIEQEAIESGSFVAEQMVATPSCFKGLGQDAEEKALIEKALNTDFQDAYGALHLLEMIGKRDRQAEAYKAILKDDDADADDIAEAEALWKAYKAEVEAYKGYADATCSKLSALFMVAFGYAKVRIARYPELYTCYMKAKEISAYIDTMKQVPDELSREYRNAVTDAVNVLFDTGITVNETAIRWQCNKLVSRVTERVKASALQAIKAEKAHYNKAGEYRQAGTTHKAISFNKWICDFVIIVLDWKGLALPDNKKMKASAPDTSCFTR